MTHPLVGFSGMCSWGNENILVSFFLSLPYTTHSLFSCLDAGVHLCGSSLCQATRAAWSSGSRRQREAKRSNSGVVSWLLPLLVWQNWEEWKYPWDGQRLKGDWGRRKKAQPWGKRHRVVFMAKWWQPSVGWLLVKDHRAHPTLCITWPCKTMRNQNKEVQPCLQSLGSSCFITHFLVVPCLPDGKLCTKIGQLRRAAKSLIPLRSPWGEGEEHNQGLGPLLPPLEQDSKRDGAVGRQTHEIVIISWTLLTS